jgi:hypothetical protein
MLVRVRLRLRARARARARAFGRVGGVLCARMQVSVAVVLGWGARVLAPALGCAQVVM